MGIVNNHLDEPEHNKRRRGVVKDIPPAQTTDVVKEDEEFFVEVPDETEKDLDAPRSASRKKRGRKKKETPDG
jgi:hypothetical protein